MNKKLHFKSLLLVALLLGGVSTVWAADETIEFAKLGLKNSVQYSDPFDGGNFTVTFGGGGNNGKYYDTGSAIRVYGDGTMTVEAKGTKKIEIIEITYDGTNKPGKNDVVNVGTYDPETDTWTGNASSVVFTRPSGSGHWRVKSVAVTYVSSGTPTCATPTFSPEGGTYEGAQNVTISTTTEGATIYYTTDGTNPTTSSDTYSAPIPVSSNTTIKAMAVKASYENSSIASAIYTIVSLQTISDARAQETGNVYTQGIVTSCSGTTGYIQDEDAAICVYGTELTVGDKVKVQGKLTTYNGLLEITVPVVEVVSSGNTITPEIMTIEEINKSTKQGWYVKIEEATVTEKTGTNTTTATIKQGESTIEVRGIAKDVEYAVNDKLTLVGNIGCFNGTQIANPTNVEVVKNEKPAIGAEDVTIEFDATSGEIEYTVDNPTSATLTATITPGIAWISNINVTADKVTFTAEANDGAERTATITLSYTNAEDKVVTITQKRYGIASVPFTFDGGKDDIATVYGLTQEGLGSDYGNNAPKLKFDSSDDNLILRINDAAKALTFDIKGNSFSGGTFDVLTSADGETYTKLASYTKLTSVQHESFLLNNDVRYIKWIYTEKKSGNVGLGNIKVFNNESVTIPDSKYTTFASTTALDFNGTGVTVYTAKVDGDVVRLSPISGNIVPANTGVILFAETGGEYTGTATTSDAVSDNELVAVITDTKVVYKAGSMFNYILQGDVFKKALDTEDGALLKAGKAYLSTSFDVTENATGTTGARELKIVFNGETTGIKAIETISDQNVYDLLGRKVAAPSKGLYIINGKKMIVK